MKLIRQVIGILTKYLLNSILINSLTSEILSVNSQAITFDSRFRNLQYLSEAVRSIQITRGMSLAAQNWLLSVTIQLVGYQCHAGTVIVGK